MTALILNGRDVRDARMPELKARLGKLVKPPVLAIIQVGDRDDSNAYIRAKMKFAEKLGVPVKHVRLPETISTKELVVKVWECNEDESVKGIVVQLPLPLAIDQDEVIEAISPKKDVDALTPANVERWLEGREDALLPATTRGVKELLEYYKIPLDGTHAVVVGRSNLVGKPLAAFCMNENASVTVCHRKTADLAAETRQADILIVAAGKPRLITLDHVREGVVVVDVGINTVKGDKLEDEIEGHKLVGDVDFEAVSRVASAISPVPGGVGPMTVLGLFENLADLCYS
jgi:methylenetetrahydrofolate dehydrogenase (NADP+)/methenyltetrahydrofolate cyclohydrolase